MKIEKTILIDGWLMVNSNCDKGYNPWRYTFFGTEHSLTEAHELFSEAHELFKEYFSRQLERLNPEDS